MYHRILLLLSLVLFAYNGFAQISDSINRNFYYVRKIENAYFNAINPDSLKGTGNADFRRWETFHTNHFDPTGDLLLPIRATTEYYKHLEEQASVNAGIPAETPQWELLGPDVAINSIGGSGGGKGIGRITCLQFHPNYGKPNGPDNQTLFAGAPVGGLWKSKDNGASWQSLGLDKKPQIGVTEFAVNPVNPNIMFVGTQGSDVSPRYTAGGVSMGVWMTTDGGQNFNLVREFTTGEQGELNVKRPIITKIAFHPSNSNILFISYGSYEKNIGDLEVYLYNTSGGFQKLFTLSDYNVGGQTLDDMVSDFEFLPADEQGKILYVSGHKVYRINLDLTNISAIPSPTINEVTPFTITSGQQEVITNAPWCDIAYLAVTPALKNNLYVIRNTNDVFSGSGVTGGRLTLSVAENAQTNTPTFDNRFDLPTNTGLFNGEGLRGQIEVSPYLQTTNNLPIIFLGCTRVIRSTDNGFNFAKSFAGGNYHDDIRRIAFPPYSSSTNIGLDKVFIGTDGGISYSLSQGASQQWIYTLRTPPVTQIYRVDVSNSDKKLMFGAQDGNADYFDGTKWNRVNPGGTVDGYEAVIDPSNSNIMYCQSQGASYRTNNAWSNGPVQISYGSGFIVKPIEINKASPVTIYEGCFKPNPDVNVIVNEVRKSDLRGNLNSWTQISNFANAPFNKPADNRIVAIEHEQNFASPNGYLYAASQVTFNTLGRATHAYIFRKIGENNWENISPNTNIVNENPNLGDNTIIWMQPSCIVANSSNPEQVYVGFSTYDAINNNEDPIGARKGKRKVLKYQKVGNSFNWLDISTGLPAVPVNSLVIDDLDGTLYAATDVGVFYRTPDATEWLSYTFNLPNVIVTDLAIKRSENKLVASTYGRGIWQVDIVACGPTSGATTTITTNTTFNTPRIFYGNILVNSGTLTISNTTIKMARGTKIIVNRNARLIINNATLTNLCTDARWRGVEVWGDRNAAPNSLTQGRLDMVNEATIKNAEYGVYVGKPTGTGLTMDDPDLDYSGGRLNTNNAHFINNRYGVFFAPYNQAQTLTLQNSEFVNNTSLTGELNPKRGSDIQLRIHGRSGITVESCTFLNTVALNDGQNRGLSADEVGSLKVNNCVFNGFSLGLGLAAATQPLFFTGQLQEILNNQFYAFNGSKYFDAGMAFIGNYYNVVARNNQINQNANAYNYSNSGFLYGVSIGGVGTVKFHENTIKNCFIGVLYANDNPPSFSGDIYAYKNKTQYAGSCWYFTNQNTFNLFDCNTFDNYDDYALNNSAKGNIRFDDGNSVVNYTIGTSNVPVTNFFKYELSETGIDFYNDSPNIHHYIYPKTQQNKCAGEDIIPESFGISNVTLQQVLVNCTNCNGGIPNGKAIGWFKNKLANTLNPGQRRRLIRQILDAYAENNDSQGAASWINSQNPSEAGLLLFPYYIANNQFALAQALVSALPAADSSDITTKIYYQLLLTMAQNGKTIPETDSVTVAIVNNLAHSLYPIRHNARGFMYIYNKKLIFDPLPPQGPFQRLANPNAPALDVTPENETVKIYPNPTTGNLTLSVSQGFVNNATFEITDVFGRPRTNAAITTPEQTFDLSDLPAGIYTASVKIGKSIVYVQKIIKK